MDEVNYLILISGANQHPQEKEKVMVRLSPNETYKASVKCLSNNQTKEMTLTGARLDFYVRHSDFLVTVTSNLQTKTYAPIDRKAGTKAAQAKAEMTVTASN